MPGSSIACRGNVVTQNSQAGATGPEGSLKAVKEQCVI